MKKELFNEIFGLMKKLDIPFNIGTRTNVKRLPAVQDMTNQVLSEGRLKNYVDDKGVDLVLKLFARDGAYIPQLNDLEGKQLLTNLKTFDKIVNPPTPKSAEVHLFSKLPGDPITPEAFAGQKVADQATLHSEILKQSMRVSQIDADLAKKLNLDMSKISDFEKLQVWKDKHGVPDFTKDDGGIGSLFKTISKDPVADVGTILDNLQKEGKSIVDQMTKITDLAYQMSPEGIAAEKAARKALLNRMHEGKGFAGGVFGPRNDGYFRALVRPFLLKEHEAGRIKLADNILDSLKNSNDLKSGGGNDFMYPDPVRIFRHHYGDDAFDLIPDQEVFGMGPSGYGPTGERINEVMTKAGIKPTTVQGPGNPGGYLTKGEYQAKLDELDEVRGYIQRREGRFDNMTQKEITEELADLDQRGASIKMAMEQDYPGYEVISGESKKGKEIAEKLGITARPGYPVTEAGKADLKVVKPVTKKGSTDPFKTVDMSFGQTKDRPSIRLIKNFERDLTDIELAKEGYNLQEIDILMRARRVMKEEGQNPDDALAWVRGEMADEAGVDIEEFMPDFDWGDFPGKDSFAQGGGVGSLFRPTNRAHYSAAGEVGKYAGKKVIVGLEWLLKQLKGKSKWEKEIEKLEKRTQYEDIDMKKLMKGKDKIKLYSGSVERPSNTWKSFVEDAKMFDTTPEKIAKDKFKDQWFTPYKSYAEAFTSPHDLKSKMRTVELTPKEIAIANRYKDKVNKIETISMRKKLGLPDPPKHHITTDENTVIIPRYKLRELEEADRIETDYMILEKLKKKVGLAQGGGVGSMFRRV